MRQIWVRQCCALLMVAAIPGILAPVAGARGAARSAVALGEQEAPAPPRAPANDRLEDAQPVGSLPAALSGTTVGASIEAGEPESRCRPGTLSSVWYTFSARQAQQVALELQAQGKLEATVDLYRVVRSTYQPIACAVTGRSGRAALRAAVAKGGEYAIRVAALAGSRLAPFTLQVYVPTPPQRPPGAPLPAAGASGRVDRIQYVNAVYSAQLREGVSYIVSLVNKTPKACVSAALYGPRTTSFESARPLARLRCSAYTLFTPGPGHTGRYVLEVTPSQRFNGLQRFHLAVAAASPAEIGPGATLRNNETVSGRLSAAGASVLRIYHIRVRSHSVLTLRLRAGESTAIDLQLREESGRLIDCACGSSGNESMQRTVRPGRYYVVVAIRRGSQGSYRLFRESRSLTTTTIAFANGSVHPGESVPIVVSVRPGAGGPVGIEVQRYNPVFGWQFDRELHVLAVQGSASVPFPIPAVGRYRAKATFNGTPVAAPSRVGYTYLSVG